MKSHITKIKIKIAKHLYDQGKIITELPKNDLKGGLDRLREWVRVRDNYTCQRCYKKWIEGQRRFDVHHLDNVKGSYKYDKDHFDRLITLCHKCHFNFNKK